MGDNIWELRMEQIKQKVSDTDRGITKIKGGFKRCSSELGVGTDHM